jgi:tellurite resistance protein TerC
VLLYAAVKMARGGSHPQPQRNLALRALRRIVPTSDRLHGQRFLVRDGGRVLATPLLLALIMIETTDVIFAVDSIPAILAVSTDTFVVFTSNVFALLGMRALYFLLAASAARFRYLQPAMAVILAAVAAKLLLADLYEFPAWASPAFIAAVLAAAAAMSLRDRRRRGTPAAPPANATPGEQIGEPDENQADQRLRGRPGQGTAVLHQRARVHEEGGHPARSGPLSDAHGGGGDTRAQAHAYQHR